MSDATGKMGVRQMVFFCVCAVIVLSTLTASAKLGPSGVFWWIVALILFIGPSSMVLSELGTTYPSDGGTYEWIAQAFGPRMGTRATFFYWISNGIWIPSGLFMLVGTFSDNFMPNMPLLGEVGIVLVLTWLIILFVCLRVEVGLTVTIVGAIIKTFLVLVLGATGLYFAMKHGPANEISLRTMTPSLSEGFGFFSVIIYNVTGFELVACMGSVLKNPVRDMPKAIIISALTVLVLYLIGSMGIIMAVPLSSMDLVSGLTDAIHVMFGGKTTFGLIFVSLFMLSIIGDLVTWTMGPSRAAAAAAAAGHFPAILGKWHPKFQTPYMAAIAQGSVATVITLVYAIVATGGAGGIFWSIFSFSSVCIISSYLPLYASFFKLRFKDPNRPRPYRVPGGKIGMYVFGGLTIFFISLAVLLFLFPDIFSLHIDWSASGPTLIGLVVFFLIGEGIIRYAEKKSGSDPFHSQPLPIMHFDDDSGGRATAAASPAQGGPASQADGEKK